MPSVDASRGTALWGMNWFRQDALSRILDDLVMQEASGLKDEDCDKVHQALQIIANELAGYPNNTLLAGSVLKQMRKLIEKYEIWNSHGPAFVKERRESLWEIREARRKLTNVIRDNQYLIERELDFQLVEAIVNSLSSLVRALPTTFTKLAEAIDRFNTRK